MPKHCFSLLAALLLTSVATFAAETAPQTPMLLAKNTMASATPSESDAPKKPGFFKRVFGAKPVATPIPIEKATPKPQRTTRKTRPTPAAHNDEEDAKPTVEKDDKNEDKKGAESADSKPPEPEKPAPSAPEDAKPPAPEKPPVESKHGKKGAPPVAKKTGNTPPEGLDAEGLEKWKYNDAKAKALEDPEIVELKHKADATPDEAEGRKALRAYNRALYNKMRRIDPSIKDRIDRIEAGVMKRLGGTE